MIFFIPYVLSNGRMKKIRARNPWVFAALIDICEYCGIELVKTSLGKVDNMLKEMTDRMGNGNKLCFWKLLQLAYMN